MSKDTTSQTQSKPATLPEETRPGLETGKSRLANLLHAFSPKKAATPEKPAGTKPPSFRPAIGPDRAALFLDSKGRIVSAQPRCAEFFGRQAEELTGVNIKELLKTGFDKEVTNVLVNGPQEKEQSFHVLALRKDGSEFATHLAFKYVIEDVGFCWTVLVHAPTASTPGDPQLTIATTETATEGQTESEADEKLSGTQSGASRAERAQLERVKFEADKRLRRIRREYGDRIVQLEQDLSAERQLSENLSKKVEGLKPSDEPQSKSKAAELAVKVEKTSSELRTLHARAEENEAARKQLMADLEKEREANKLSRHKADELAAQVQKLQAAVEQAEARARESAAQPKDWEQKAANLEKSVDELTRSQAAEKNAAGQSSQRVKELEQQLRDANASLASNKTDAETENRKLTEANAKAKRDLDKERDANKLSRKKEEELNAQIQKLQKDAEQAEARARESAAQSKDWEKKATDFKKTFDELTRIYTTEQSASGQRVKEFEQKLKDANASVAANKTDAEKQNSARQRLETDNRNLTEASAKTKADLDKEREANKLSRKKEEELSAQIQKLQKSAEQSKDLEKKAADLKKNVDELTRNHAAEKRAAGQSALRVKELEEQAKRAGDDLATSKAEVEEQTSARQRLEAENRQLTAANAKAKADLTESTEKLATAEKKAAELEQRGRAGVFSLAKANAELQSERAQREQAEKNASAADAQSEKLKEKLKRQAEAEKVSQSKIAELEKTIADRGDDLARASAALRKEAKERQAAQKQSRMVSEIGTRLETNLASLEDAKKAFETSLKQKDEQLHVVERLLADANSNAEKELTERRRLEGLVAETKQQLEKLSADSKIEISRLQAAVDLGELQRKQLEADLLRSRDTVDTDEEK